MGKTLKEIPTRSASAETKPIGVAMTLDDLDVDVRSQTVAQSLERVMPPPAPATPSTVSPAPTPQAAAPASTGATQPESVAPRAQSEAKKKPASQMLSTPIPAALKKRLNRLRLEYSVSTAFILEVALNEFFGVRTDEAIAADLHSRGGRLRRNST